MDAVAAQLVARRRAAEVTDANERRLERWARRGLVRPTRVVAVSPARQVRVYDFDALTELLVVKKILDEWRVSLRCLEATLVLIQTKFEVAAPLREVPFGTERGTGRLYFQIADRWYEGRRVVQQVIRQVIVLDELHETIRARLVRPSGAAGQTERHRDRMSGQECFAGTRIPVETVIRYLDRGYDVAGILEAYPSLSAADVALARARAA